MKTRDLVIWFGSLGVYIALTLALLVALALAFGPLVSVLVALGIAMVLVPTEHRRMSGRGRRMSGRGRRR